MRASLIDLGVPLPRAAAVAAGNNTQADPELWSRSLGKQNKTAIREESADQVYLMGRGCSGRVTASLQSTQGLKEQQFGPVLLKPPKSIASDSSKPWP